MDAETQDVQETEAPAAGEGTTTEPPSRAAPAAEEPPDGKGATGEPAAEGAEGEGQDGEAPKPDGGHKRVGGFQRKIQKLEQEKQFLLEQLQARGGQPKTDPVGQEKTEGDKAAEQLNKWLDQQLEARETQRQAQAQVAEFARRTQEVRAATPDFDEVVSTVDIPTNSALGQAILTSEMGPKMLYELAANPAELARISALPPIVAAREVGRLEARLASGAVPKKAPSAATRRSAAPPPITPVTARGPSNVKPVEQMSYEEYSDWRRGQRKR